MNVLLGTTNPSKVKRFSDLLKGHDIEFITLRDINITEEPREMGNTPEENAIIKAEFYGQYFDVVICNDSGLYFDRICKSSDLSEGCREGIWIASFYSDRCFEWSWTEGNDSQGGGSPGWKT